MKVLFLFVDKTLSGNTHCSYKIRIVHKNTVDLG